MLRTQKNFKFKNVFTNLQKACVAITPLLILIACGGDSGSSTKPADDGREVATVVDMGRCTNEREGDTVYVAEKMADYLCKNRTWVDLSTISHSETKHSSSSVAKGTLSAASGNSSAVQGTSSATPGSHTSTSSSSTIAPNSVSGTSAGKESDPAQGFIRENISVTGVAQKGPFKFGSPLNLYELKKDLSPSGRVYNDEINSNKGDFVIPKVSLAYPYAKLEVAGLYRNEVTGEWSKEPMTLFALTDFSDKRAQTNSDERVQVNINLLTHLEYDRALYLVQKKGYSVYAAKKQAAQEIMTAFEFATAVTYSEDFAIFQNDGVGSGTIAGNGTLLAISALVMGNRSDAEIQTVIDKFREDIKTDGEWNDLQTKANMADWARDFKYNTIRAAVKSWNILDIPDYETYLDVYWNNVYGLGGCSEIRKGTVAPNSNKLSKYYKEYFICKVDGSKYSWVSATTIEKDTYKWAAGKSGEFKKGNVTDTIYAYNGTKWEVAARETSIGVCGSKNAGVVSEFNGTYYICKNNTWGTATVLEYDTYGWKAGSEGAVKAGSVNSDKYYVYENGAWRASSGEIENNLGACVMSREGEVGKSGNIYYICKSSVWTAAIGIEKKLGGCTAKREGEVDLYGNTYYICKNKTWTTASALEYDTYNWISGNEGEVKTGSVNSDKYYIYKNGKWQTATGIEEKLGGCTVAREGEVNKYSSSYYICKSKSWTTATALEYDTYGWKAGTEGDVKAGSVNSDKYYIYKNGKWQIATYAEKDFGGCTADREGEVNKPECNCPYYICKSKTWTIATELEYDTYGWAAGTEGEVKAGRVNKYKYYVYENGAWRYPKLSTITDSRDNQSYKTVMIGTQTWMAQNLNYAYIGVPYKRDAIDSIYISDSTSWCYENNSANCSKYGRLYTWAAAMDSVGEWSTNGRGCGMDIKCSSEKPVRGICPEGWHLPDTTEWRTLFNAVGGEAKAGKMLKSTSGWYDDGDGSDSYSFSALPAGSCYPPYYIYLKQKAVFWSSTEDYPLNSHYAYSVGFGYYRDSASIPSSTYNDKYNAYSVRCVKD